MAHGPGVKKPQSTTINPLESLKSLTPNKLSDSFVDQLVGNYGDEDDYFDDEAYLPKKKEAKSQPQTSKEFTVFSAAEHHENESVRRQIEELTGQIKNEISAFKNTDSALLEEVQNIEKVTLQSLPEKAGIYHIRFLEIVLAMLRSLREKIGESKTWLTAMMSKKKKRGSLFAARAKSKGTQYSLSQEISNARSVQ